MIQKVTYKNREDWLAVREGNGFRLGGSNIGTILGVSKYCSPYEYWDKLKNQPKVDDTNENQYRGQFMEDGIARWFEYETGRKVNESSAGYVCYHNDKYPEYVWASPDREVFTEKSRGVRSGLEIKDTKMIVDFDNLESVPSEWFCQCQFYMGIMERPSWFLAVNDGTKQLKWREIKFDKEFFDKMIAEAIAWVEKYVFGNEIPPMETAEDVQKRHPQSTEGIIRVGKDIADKVEKLKVVQGKIKELGAIEKELKNEICAQFDDRDTLEFEGVKLATYKTSTRETINAKLMAERLGVKDLSDYTNVSTYRTLKV